MSRAQNVIRAQELRAQGLTHDAIAATLGVARSTAGDYLADPDRTKARERRRRYGGTCERCGVPTDGSNGWGSASSLCAKCTNLEQHERRYWTPDTILERFRAFHAGTGRTPAATDTFGVHQSRAVLLSPERLAEVEAAQAFRLPHTAVVIREFGSWSAAIDAAGLPQNASGGAAHRHRRPSVARLFIVLTKNGHGWVEQETVDALTPELAVEKAAKEEGDYLVIAEAQYRVYRVAPITKLGVVTE